MLSLGWDNTRGHGALQTDATTGALAIDEGLGTAALLTMFTWAPATSQEIEEAGLDEQLGWWGDADVVLSPGERVIGSKLWLLSRRGLNTTTLAKAREYLLQAFAWWVEEGLASEVDVEVARLGAGVLGIEVTITPPDTKSPAVQLAYQHTMAVT